MVLAWVYTVHVLRFNIPIVDHGLLCLHNHDMHNIQRTSVMVRFASVPIYFLNSVLWCIIARGPYPHQKKPYHSSWCFAPPSLTIINNMRERERECYQNDIDVKYAASTSFRRVCAACGSVQRMCCRSNQSEPS